MARCFSVIRGKCLRATRLDSCCTPPDGGNNPDGTPKSPCSVVVSRGFTQISYDPEVESGQEITVRTADGRLCINDRSCDQFKRWNLSIEFCEVDPDLVSMVAGLNTEMGHINGGDLESVGFRSVEGQQCDNFALELWTGIPSQDCDQAGSREQFGYVALFCVSGGTLGGLTFENDAATFSVSGFSKSGSGWGVGPYRVVSDADGNPSPLLTRVGRGEHMLLRVTDVAPPCNEDTPCGCQDMPEHARSYRPTADACVIAGTGAGGSNFAPCASEQQLFEVPAAECPNFGIATNGGFRAVFDNSSSTEDAALTVAEYRIVDSNGDIVTVDLLTGNYTGTGGAPSGTITVNASGCDTTTDANVEAGTICQVNFNDATANLLDDWFEGRIRDGADMDISVAFTSDSGDALDTGVATNSQVLTLKCEDA